jgi:hypothetical protein
MRQGERQANFTRCTGRKESLCYGLCYKGRFLAVAGKLIEISRKALWILDLAAIKATRRNVKKPPKTQS